MLELVNVSEVDFPVNGLVRLRMSSLSLRDGTDGRVDGAGIISVLLSEVFCLRLANFIANEVYVNQEVNIKIVLLPYFDVERVIRKP